MVLVKNEKETSETKEESPVAKADSSNIENTEIKLVDVGSGDIQSGDVESRDIESVDVESVDVRSVEGENAVKCKDEKDTREFSMKHPLQNVWTMWYLENDRSKAWADMQNEIASFDTIEDFWSLYNHIKPPSEINLGCDYSMFKKGIRPMWEDEGNMHGGCWVINLHRVQKGTLDSLWLDVLLCLIGEMFDNSDEICGAVVNVRKNCRISIWTSNGSNREAALEIGYKVMNTLQLNPQSFQYQLHKDTMVRTDATVKPIYTL